jgi:hypothetical protein
MNLKRIQRQFQQRKMFVHRMTGSVISDNFSAVTQNRITDFDYLALDPDACDKVCAIVPMTDRNFTLN